MNKGARQIYFVCVAISTHNELLTKIIPASSPEEASVLFNKEFSCTPKEIMGPFYKKRSFILENTRVLKFNNMQSVKAIYNEWIVNAFMLKEPENHAYLIFIKREDGIKSPLPKGTIIVPISNLRFI